MANAIAQLKADHVRMRALFGRLLTNTPLSEKARGRILADLERETKIHAQVEEEVFYPAFKEAASARPDRHLFFKSTESHHAADVVLAQLKAATPGSEVFMARAELLQELVLTHMKEEEGEMFLRARAIMPAAELAEVGRLMDERRATLVAQWKSPLMRPLKKVQGALQAMLPTSVKNAKAAAIGKALPSKRAGNGRRFSAGQPLRRA
jgi:hypothetical protein